MNIHFLGVPTCYSASSISSIPRHDLLIHRRTTTIHYWMRTLTITFCDPSRLSIFSSQTFSNTCDFHSLSSTVYEMAGRASTGKQQSIPATALSDTGLQSDEQRAQELDRYYTPSNKSALRLTDRDSALPAHMQLLCWRLGMRRALVSLIDRDTQYYVAESTRTMDIQNPSEYVDPDDGPLALVGPLPIPC
jgi:hypothetical protein